MTESSRSDYYNSPRVRMRELTDEFFDPDSPIESVHIPDLVEKVTAAIDQEQMTRYPMLRQMVDTFIREYVQRRLAGTRGLLLLGNNEIVSREEFEKRLEQRANKFATWMEHVGSKGHVRLMKMKKADLLAAADERTRAGMTDLHIAALWRRLAQDMTDDEEVENRFTTEQIAMLTDKLKITVVIEDSDGPVIVKSEKNGNGDATVAALPNPPAPTPPGRRAPTPPAGTRPNRAGTSGVRVRPPQEPRPRRSR